MKAMIFSNVVQIINKVNEDNMKKALLLCGLLMTLTIPSGLWAQQAGYSQANLVSNVTGVATTTDPQLLNPWGISVLPGEDFWIADNNSGVSTLYDQRGNKQPKWQLQPRLSNGNRGQRQRLLLQRRFVYFRYRGRPRRLLERLKQH